MEGGHSRIPLSLLEAAPVNPEGSREAVGVSRKGGTPRMGKKTHGLGPLGHPTRSFSKTRWEGGPQA